MAVAYVEISTFMNEAGVSLVGQPMAITRINEEGVYQFDAAIPVDFIPSELSGRINAGLSPAVKAVRAIHHGGYDQMKPSYEKLSAYMSAHGLPQGKVSWEHYVTDPGKTGQQDMVTFIYIMLGTS